MLKHSKIGRRDLFRTSAGIVGGALLSREEAAAVPDKPGLGAALNEDVVGRRLAPNTGYFDPTPQWNHERSSDWLWSMIQHEEAQRLEKGESS